MIMQNKQPWKQKNTDKKIVFFLNTNIESWIKIFMLIFLSKKQFAFLYKKMNLNARKILNREIKIAKKI